MPPLARGAHDTDYVDVASSNSVSLTLFPQFYKCATDPRRILSQQTDVAGSKSKVFNNATRTLVPITRIWCIEMIRNASTRFANMTT